MGLGPLPSLQVGVSCRTSIKLKGFFGNGIGLEAKEVVVRAAAMVFSFIPPRGGVGRGPWDGDWKWEMQKGQEGAEFGAMGRAGAGHPLCLGGWSVWGLGGRVGPP